MTHYMLTVRRLVRLAPGFGWPLMAAVVALIPFAGGFSLSRVFHVRDLGMYFWPKHLWLRQTVWSGDWPFWDPYVGGGQSVVAEGVTQLFLLPVTLLRLITPDVCGFNAWVAVPFPLMGVGTWLWLRRHNASPAAAFVGSVVATLSGPVVSTGNFPNLSWTTAFIPWILWSGDRVCEAAGFGRIAALAVFVGSQALAGEPVTFAASGVVLLAYVAVAVPSERWRDWRARLLRVSSALVSGVLLAAVQIVPLSIAASRSPRSMDLDTAYWSFHPLSLMELLIPHLFGHVYDGYVDTFPWVTALNSAREPLFYSVYVGAGAFVLAMIGSRVPAGRRWRAFWWTVCIVAILSALGKYTVFYPALQQIAPVLKTFRFPVKYLVVCAFALAALAASGADALLAHSRGEEAMKRPLGVWLFLGTVGAITAVVGLAGVWRAEWIDRMWTMLGSAIGLADPAKGADWLTRAAAPLWLRLSVFAALIAFLVGLVWQRHRFAPRAAWVVCAVALIDPISVNYDVHPTLPASRLGPPEWVAATRDHPDDRVYIAGRLRKGTSESERLDAPSRFPVPFDWDVQESVTMVTIQFAHAPAAWGVRELISYDLPQLWPREYTMMLRAFKDASPADRLRFLQRTGTRYCLLQEPPHPGVKPLIAPALSAPVALYECHDDPRRVYVTAGAIVEPDLRRQLTLLFDEHHDHFASVLLEREPPAPAGHPGAGALTPGVRIVHERNTELVLDASIGPSGGYVNVLDSFDPYWRVEVDGHPAPLLRANGVFRAVRLAPGRHEVRLRYRPTHLYAGVGLSTFSVVVLFAGYWAGPARRARRLARAQTAFDSATRARTP